MLTLGSQRKKLMTFSRTEIKDLTDAEWNELVALKNAINENPASVHPEKMEKFTELLVRSLEGKCDSPPPKNWRGSSLSE
jgi:hypothetical protein